MADDPFKRRYSSPQQKKPLIISQQEIERIANNARIQTSEQSKQDTFSEEHLLKLKEAKELARKIACRKETGSEQKQRQYDTELKCVHDELAVEARQELRKERVLDKAYKRLFEQTDRVKYFNAAKDFAKMLKERDDQVSKKASQQDVFAKYDIEFLLGMLKDVDLFQEEERNKKRVKGDDKKKNKENWAKQHREILKKRDKERWERLQDGYLIWNDVEQEKLKELEKAHREKEEIRKYKTALDHQIQDKCNLFDVHQKLEEAKEAKARLFDDFKREMKLEHKKIKEGINKEKDSCRELVAGTLIDDSISQRMKEEANLQKAIREAEKKAVEEDAIKKLNHKEAQKEFKEFYDKEMSAKQRRQYEDRLREHQEMRRIVDITDKLKEAEDSKAQRHDGLEKEAQHIQLHQIAKCKANKRDEELEDIKDYMDHMRGLDEEEEMFQKYAQMEIEECEARGIDTYAMRKAARPGIECGKGPLFRDRGHIRPMYYAATGSGNDLVHVQRSSEVEDTKSRLGFINWNP